MKKLIISLVFLSSGAMAATPFTISGNRVAAIFECEHLWRKLGGTVETITFQGYANETSIYSIVTTENIPIIDGSGVTTGYVKVPCRVLATVSYSYDEKLVIKDEVPKFKVTSVDFAECPLSLPKSN